MLRYHVSFQVAVSTWLLYQTFVSRLVVCLAVACRETSCGPPTAFLFGHQCTVGVLPGPTGVPLSPGGP